MRRPGRLNEIIAEIRNKLQAPLSVLSALSEGKQSPDRVIKIAREDLEAVIEILNNLKD